MQNHWQFKIYVFNNNEGEHGPAGPARPARLAHLRAALQTDQQSSHLLASPAPPLPVRILPSRSLPLTSSQFSINVIRNANSFKSLIRVFN